MSEIKHSGIQGQKWGVRRYQNEDGTLTSEGKNRYRKYSRDAYRKEKLRSRDIHSLSNKELAELNTRQALEKQYRANNPEALKNFVAGLVGVAAATTSVAAIFKNSPQIIKAGKSAVIETARAVGRINLSIATAVKVLVISGL